MSIMPNPIGVRIDHRDDEALLLVESLLHELIGAGALTIDRAVVVVEIARDARHQIREARGLANAHDEGALDTILCSLHRERR